MNFGCGSVQPEGWVNVDKDHRVFGGECFYREQGAPLLPASPWCITLADEVFPDDWDDSFDYIVANHSLSDLTFHELPGALSELYRVLKPGGVLRVLVPDFGCAIEAWQHRDGAFFPQGDDLTDLDERFCTFVTWFGTVGSVFTDAYLDLLLTRAGFKTWGPWSSGDTFSICDDPEIRSLDGDRTTSLIFEGRK